MKSLAKNNSIFSKLREDFLSLLSFSDGSKYTTSEKEESLTGELLSSTEQLNSIAKNYEDSGMISIRKSNNTSNSSKPSKVNRIKPPVENKEYIKTIIKEINDKDLER